MSRFDDCLAFVLQWEGGYVHHPLDRGGATNKGITQKTYDDWRIGEGLGRQPVSGLSGDELLAIYRDRYWTPAGCANCPEPVDLALLDSAVNCGVKQAVKFLQRALCLPDDGAFGPMTKHAVNNSIHSPQEIAERLINERDEFYSKLIAMDARQAVFAKGWGRRLDSLREAVTP